MGIFEKALITRENIPYYIPQRDPIIMVDGFYGIEGATSYSTLTIAEDNIFYQEGKFNEYGIMEHIAQSAALRVGYLARLDQKEIPLGFIGAITHANIIAHPVLNDQIKTEITVDHVVMNVTLISAVSKVNNEMIVSCKMKIYLQEEKENNE